MSELNAGHSFDVDVRSFQADVIEGSKSAPVFLCFFADQVPPSVETRRHLERLAEAYGGKFRLGRVDVSRDQTLAQHLRVQNLPSIKIIRDGQLADELEGPQGERVLKQLVDQHTMSSGELIRDQLAELLEARDYRTAQSLLQRALQEEPANSVFKVELADVLAQSGEPEAARAQLLGLADDTDEIERPRTRIALLEELASLPERGTIEALVADTGDPRARYQLALLLAGRGEYEGAFDQALSIIRSHRSFEDELGRRTLVRLFGLLPKGSELVKRYRRQLFALLH